MKDRKEPVTLEELLRFKRNEKPAPEFWDEFDREFKRKTLQAFVKKESWWDRLSVLLHSRMGSAIPVAAAIVMTAFFMVRQDVTSEMKVAPVIEPSMAQVPTFIEESPVVEAPVIASSLEEYVADTVVESAFVEDSISVTIEDSNFTRDFSQETVMLSMADTAIYSDDSVALVSDLGGQYNPVF